MRSFGCDNLVHSVVICHPGRFPISQAKAMKARFTFSNVCKGFTIFNLQVPAA